MSAAILQLQDIELSIGGTRLFSGVNMAVETRARLCIVGRNGSGKSTLMRIIAGRVTPDDGDVYIQPGINIAYMPQDPEFPKGISALEYVESQEDATHYNAERVLDLVDIAYDKPLDTLSGGEARRVSLAHALATEPDILMLDEPTNHLDIATIEWLEGFLSNYQGAIILISHDRTFLENTTNGTLWLDQRVIRRLNKGYKHFDEWAEKIVEETTKSRIKMDKAIEEENAWASGGIRARRKRNQGRLKRLYDMRERRAQHLKDLKIARLKVEAGQQSGRSIIEARNITKGYGERTLISDFSTLIMRGDRIGIIGANGTGKTTLLRMLVGDLKPDQGKIKIGTRLDITYLDQNRTALNPKRTLWETLCPDGGDHIMVQDKSRHVVAYLRDFMFKADQARSPVGILSGGEKNRLLLALALAKTSNMLILDEPTNDLDMDTLDRLQEMLSNYEGTLILVSHDRDFLDNVVTSTIVLEGDGKAVEYAGGYSDYLKQKQGGKSKDTSSKQKARKKPSAKPKPERRKLSYKQEYILENNPKEIERLEGLITDCELKLADPNLYVDNPDTFEQTTQELHTHQEQRDKLEEEWLEIAMLKEQMEE
ncbi:MAG: ABC-F family ATP-binding cassette domain-containing protein [Alphaproteobacteria bacterium]